MVAVRAEPHDGVVEWELVARDAAGRETVISRGRQHVPEGHALEFRVPDPPAPRPDGTVLQG